MNNSQNMVRLPADQAILVYYTEEGERLEQPVSDLIYVGNLIDPDTGDDLAIDHVLVPKQTS